MFGQVHLDISARHLAFFFQALWPVCSGSWPQAMWPVLRSPPPFRSFFFFVFFLLGTSPLKEIVLVSLRMRWVSNQCPSAELPCDVTTRLKEDL
eukprot:SAG11_NODE_18266_length_495_cov_19.035354_2_plen_93_part_01